MTAKKWLIMFAVTVLIIAAAMPVFNYITDPFGVFEGAPFRWTAYEATNNPRTAKITYLDEHYEEYDSYIIGCSSSSSFSPDTFEKYVGGSWYNMIMYGADMLDVEQTVAYMIENYTVKNLVLSVYLDNGAVYDEESNGLTHSMLPRVDGGSEIEFYSRFLFATPRYGLDKIEKYYSDSWLTKPYDVFDEATGAYDKRARDVEPIGNLEEYLKDYPEFVNYPYSRGVLSETERCMESVARIVEMCERDGVNLTVVTAPTYADYVKIFDVDEVKEFYSALADVTDFWDFSYSSVSCEPRYFYDATHFRNSVGDMALARMFGDKSVYIPEDFGQYVTAENATEAVKIYDRTEFAETESRDVPVLMYHHIADEVNGNNMVVSPARFREQMEALYKAGYTAITVADLQVYVSGGYELPEKPVLITFDDGYESNYTYAYPILAEFGFRATVFITGSSFGQDTYKDTGYPIIPHFNAEQAKEMVESGVFVIQSHTFDMHQSTNVEGEDARQMITAARGESEEEFIAAIREDHRLISELIGDSCGLPTYAVAYPLGHIEDIPAAVLREEGVRVTFSTKHGMATVVKGLPQSLYGIWRYTINDDFTGDALIQLIEQ